MTVGIYTLANDVVYDQLIALLNSIEVNVGDKFPVCVIPYDDRLDRISQEIDQRSNVQLLENQAIIARWEEFASQIWQVHPFAKSLWESQGITGVSRMGMHRRFCGFDEDSPFEKFIYFDGDVLVLQALDYLFEQLDHQDFVTYDFQYKDPSHVYNINASQLFKIFTEERLTSEIFCAGCFASKRGLFAANQRAWLLENLKAGEAEILYPNGPDQSILNYMVMRSRTSYYNFALQLPAEQKTGCSVTSPHFKMQDNLLYDKGQPLTYLHYIGVPSYAFTKVCEGENLDFPYRELFLHYRYLYESHNYPLLTGKSKAYSPPPPNLAQKIFKKLVRAFKN